MEPPQGRSRLASEILKGSFVHEHHVRRRDYVAETPAQFAEVARVERLDTPRVVGPTTPQHPLVPRLRRGMDGHNGQVGPECLAEDFQLGSSSESVDQDPLSLDARESPLDRKSTRLNSSHTVISYAVFCLKKKRRTI